LKDGEFLIEAKFKYFSLGDASHFVFQDTNGVNWDFGSNSSPYSFEELLPEDKMDMSNQGWGSNEALQGKWFKIIYRTEQREQYIDGPIGPVDIIVNAVESVFKKEILDNEKGFKIALSNSETSGKRFFHKSDVNPSKTIRIDGEEVDPGTYTVQINSEKLKYKLRDVYCAPDQYYWPKKGKYVLLNNVDIYANSGTESIYVLNVLTGSFIEIDKTQFQEGLKVGNREMLNIELIYWLDETTFKIEGCFTYLMGSGHPGIDQNRKKKLGKNFGNRKDVVRLLDRTFEIVQDTVTELLETNVVQVKEIPLKDYVSNGDVEKKVVDHYICYKGIYDDKETNVWVSFTASGKGIEIKYKDQKVARQIVFEKEKVYPNGTISSDYKEIVDGEINGTYTLTHSGIWDYVSYIRAKDLKEFSFSIKHDGNPYGKKPCF